MDKPYSATTGTMHRWGIGGIGEYFLYMTFNFASDVFTIGFGLDPRAVGLALFIPRMADAVLDPFLGHLSDITHTRWGRRRPFLFGAAILGSLVALFMWRVNPAWGDWFVQLAPHVPDCLAWWWATRDWSQTVMFLWMTVGSILAFTIYGIYALNNQALGYELSDDYNDRARVQAIRTFYWSIAGLGGANVLFLATGEFFHQDMVEGIRFLSIPMAILILVCGLLPAFTVRERFQSANRQHVNLWQALRATLRIRPFVMYLLLTVTKALGTSLYGRVGTFIVIYSVCGGDKHLGYSLPRYVSYTGIALSFLMMFLARPICRLIGKYRGLVLSNALALLSALTLPFFALPGHPYLYLGQCLCFAILGHFAGVAANAIMPDICDMDELRSGERREALFAAVMAFASKLENSVISLIGGFLLYYIGYNQTLPQQPQDVLDKLRFYGFGALIIFSALGFAISFFIPVTEKKMAAVRAELEERRRARAAESPLAANLAGLCETPEPPTPKPAK